MITIAQTRFIGGKEGNGKEMTETYADGKLVIENVSIDECVKIMNFINDEHKENFLPRPCVRDGNGKLIKYHTPRDFYLKLQEEIFEAIENLEIYNQMTEEYGEGYDGTKSAVKHTAEEIADVITVCISYLNAIGYDEKERSELFAKVNEKNEKRGYFRNA